MAGLFVCIAAEVAVNVGTSLSAELNARSQSQLKELFTCHIHKKILTVIALLKDTVSKFPKELFKLGFGLVIVKVMVMLMLTLAIWHRLELLLKKYHRHKLKSSCYQIYICVMK